MSLISLLVSVLTYEKALKHSSMIVEETSGTARIRGKSLKLERAAIALMVAAAVQKSKVKKVSDSLLRLSICELTGWDETQNDFAAAASSLAQSHRLWTRAADNITRISFQLPATALSVENITNDDPANPFQVSTPAIPANPANQPSADSRVDVAKPAASSRRQIGGLSWRISEVSLWSVTLEDRKPNIFYLRSFQGLLECLFYFSTATIQRGTSRDTECLLQQAQDYALAVDSKGLANRALIKRATVQLYVGQIEKSRLMIDEAQLESMTVRIPHFLYCAQSLVDLTCPGFLFRPVELIWPSMHTWKAACESLKSSLRMRLQRMIQVWKPCELEKTRSTKRTQLPSGTYKVRAE